MAEAATAPAPTATASAPAPTAPAPSPAPSTAPSPAPAPAPAAPAGQTALALGNPDAVSGDPWADVPEKFQVKKEDGSLDQTATFAKMRESQTALERRMAAGEARPYRAVDYKVEVPETLKEAISADDPEIANFKKDAHEAGYSQKQFDLALRKHFEIAQKLVGGAAQLDEQTAREKLTAVWGEGDKYQANATLAFKAVKAFGGDLAEALDSELGNNPTFLQFAARVGAQLGEDTPPGNTRGGPAEDIVALQGSKAYNDPKDPQHAAVTAKVKAWYARQPGADIPIG